jgi:hypothetical protein
MESKCFPKKELRTSHQQQIAEAPEEMVGAEQVREGAVKGYRVKVRYKPTTADEENAKKQTISRTIVQALNRLRGNE